MGVGDSRGMFEEWWFACHGCKHQWSITGSGLNRPKPGDNMQCMLTGENMQCPQCEWCASTHLAAVRELLA